MGKKRAPAKAFLFDRGEPTPTKAFRFTQNAPAVIAAEGEKRKFEGVAYSGDAIEGHWYWGNVVFDLATTKTPKKLPMLMSHDRDKIAGFADQVTIGSDIRVSGMLSGKTDEGKTVAALSDEGFPWQMSVHIEPQRVDEINAGESVTVNGRQFAGPIHVFRNSTLREVSFTPTGWDPNTSAVAMEHGTSSSEGVSMTPEQIKELQDKAAKFEADAKAEKAAREKADADKATAEAKVKEFEVAQEKARTDKREADIKALFTATGIAFSDASAKPYRSMDEESFAAISTQMRETAKKIDPKLFSELATTGVTGGEIDAFALSAKAQDLMFAAEKNGRVLDVVDAVKQAKTLLAGAAA